MVSCGIDGTVRVYEEVEEADEKHTGENGPENGSEEKLAPPGTNGIEPNGSEQNGTDQIGIEGHDTNEPQQNGDTQEPQDTEMADADTGPDG
jgi:COMPASS component SWD3